MYCCSQLNVLYTFLATTMIILCGWVPQACSNPDKRYTKKGSFSAPTIVILATACVATSLSAADTNLVTTVLNGFFHNPTLQVCFIRFKQLHVKTYVAFFSRKDLSDSIRLPRRWDQLERMAVELFLISVVTEYLFYAQYLNSRTMYLQRSYKMYLLRV